MTFTIRAAFENATLLSLLDEPEGPAITPLQAARDVKLTVRQPVIEHVVEK